MKKSKLNGIFQALDEAERRELNKFLRSPWFNHRADVLALYGFLLSMPDDLSKQKAWESTYPGQPFDDANMRHCMSFLFQLIERFLVEKTTPLSAVEQKIHLAKTYRERGMERHFKHAMQAARRMLDRLPENQQYYHSRHLFELEKYEYGKSFKRAADYDLHALGQAYDVQFMANKLKQSCLQLSHQAVIRVDYDAGLLPSVLAFLESSEYLDIPAIAIYFYTYRALTEGSEKDFQKLKKQLLSHQHQFPPAEMADVLLLAINFCIKKLNTGQEKYVREAFELYRMGLENGLLLQGHLSRFAYKNTVALGLRLGEFEWIEKFIPEYSPHLNLRYRKSYFTYNLARLAYFRKDFSQAMKLLVKVGSADLLLNIDARILLLKMYFELDEHDVLDAQLSSFRVFLNRKKVMGYHRDNYLTIIDLIKKLLYLNPNDRPAARQLLEEVNASNVTEKEWLAKQLIPLTGTAPG